jgi:hypothetical protein
MPLGYQMEDIAMTGSGWLAGLLIAAVLIVVKLVRARRVPTERRGLGL